MKTRLCRYILFARVTSYEKNTQNQVNQSIVIECVIFRLFCSQTDNTIWITTFSVFSKMVNYEFVILESIFYACWRRPHEGSLSIAAVFELWIQIIFISPFLLSLGVPTFLMSSRGRDAVQSRPCKMTSTCKSSNFIFRTVVMSC